MIKSLNKFKNRLLGLRILKASLAGVSLGAMVSGVLLILHKLEIISVFPMLLLPIGASVALIVFLIVFFALWTSKRKLADRLDRNFGLNERVQTTLAFRNEIGEMYELQREDTEKALANIKKSRLKARHLWVYFLLLILGVGVLTSGVLLKEKEPYIPPVEVIPFEISEMQIAGIEELIKYVDSSQMEEPYKSDMLSALSTLLTELKAATTEPEMQASLAKALTEITEITYDSSSMTEILNELWNTGDTDIMMLAKVLNTSHWKEPDWGDFAEKYDAFRTSLISDGFEEDDLEDDLESAETSEDESDEAAEPSAALRWKLESLSRKTANALTLSGIAETDPLYTSVYKLINGTDASDGLASIPTSLENAEKEELIAAIDIALSAMTNELYGTVSAQKINTNVGEYTLTRLGMLFSVPIPEFERPDFVKNGEDIDKGNQDGDDKEDEDTPSSGGVGEGVKFGSEDLVLDPLTGEYVEYGTLYAKYNTLMIEKLGDEKYGYTEEQKKAIEKYFALLYGGFKDEEK